MIRRTLQTAACIFVTQAAAVPAALAAPVDPSSLVTRTCIGQQAATSATIRRRLATFILSDQGDIADDPVHRVLEFYSDDGAKPRDARDGVRAAVTLLQQQLAAEAANPSPPSPGSVRLQPASIGTGTGAWLFAREEELSCRIASAGDSSHQDGGGAGSADAGRRLFNRLRLRQNADALAATGQDRLTAGAAQVGFLRERTALQDGTSRTDTTFSFQGALGVSLRNHEDSSLLLYASYERRRQRSDPPPQLAAGASQSDKDTNILQFGVTGNQLLSIPRVPVMLTGSASYIANRVNDSERLRLKVSASPNAFLPGGLCYLGAFADAIDLGFAQLRGRCNLDLLVQVNHVLDPGSTTPGASDEFILGGVRGGLDIATGTNNGVIAGVSYEYQHRFHGGVPSFHQLTAHLKYRHWFDEQRFAMEFGFEYTDGVNPESFIDEHRTRFGFGFIF
jgi:hypothetical protein